MEIVLTKLIEQLNSSVFILLAMLAVSYWAVCVVTKLVVRFGHHETKLEKIDALSDKLIELKTKVDLIYQNTNPNKLVASQSPISITPAGKSLAEKIQAVAMFKKYEARLVIEVEKLAPQNAYDVQTTSMTVSKEKLLPILNAEEINLIKEEAFKRGLLVEDIMAIFGVYLRDRVLEKKGIPVSECDNPPKK